jgi:general transcription factor 3C polypeptide 3 (transcription factor C subunit 4)
LKASRAKKLLQKKAIEKEKKKAEAEASGIDWLSDDSDDEPQVICLVLSTFTYSTIFF